MIPSAFILVPMFEKTYSILADSQLLKLRSLLALAVRAYRTFSMERYLQHPIWRNVLNVLSGYAQIPLLKCKQDMIRVPIKKQALLKRWVLTYLLF